MILNFLILVFAHLLGDYPLQPDFLAQNKGKNIITLISHAGIWTGTILTAAHLIGFSVTLTDIAILFFVHTIADAAKAKRWGFYKNLNPLVAGLAIDQAIHMLQIIAFLIYK